MLTELNKKTCLIILTVAEKVLNKIQIPFLGKTFSELGIERKLNILDQKKGNCRKTKTKNSMASIIHNVKDRMCFARAKKRMATATTLI